MPQPLNKNNLLILTGLVLITIILAGFFLWWQKPSNSTTQQPSNAITTPSDRAETFSISGSEEFPRFTQELKINPFYDAQIGEILYFSIWAEDPEGIERVTAVISTEQEDKEIELKLKEGTKEEGRWGGEWEIADVLSGSAPDILFEAKNTRGETTQLNTYFHVQPGKETWLKKLFTPFSPKEVLAATACPLSASGNTMISSNCYIPQGTEVGVEAGNLTIRATITMERNSTLIFNQGKSIIMGSGGYILKSASNTVIKKGHVAVTYTLTVYKTGPGSGTVTSNPAGINCGSDCSQGYNSGTSVTLTATPSAGSTFAGWSGSGCSGTGNCTVTMNNDKSVTATFNTAPAGCSSSPTQNLSAGDNSIDFQTPHDYPNNLDCESNTYTCPSGYTGKVYVKYDTESSYDWFYIYNADDNTYDRWSGNSSGFVWKEHSGTRRVKFRFTSDSSVTDWGVDVNTIKCETTGPPCTDECSPSGSKACCGSWGNKTCGNYDADSCLEWSGCSSCGTDGCVGTTYRDYYCSGGNCSFTDYPDDPSCVSCTSHDYKSCYDNDVYWYDSCDNREEKYQECYSDSWTDNYQCSGDWVQRQKRKRGCSGSSCYDYYQWENYEDCAAQGKICSGGACVVLAPAPPTCTNVKSYPTLFCRETTIEASGSNIDQVQAHVEAGIFSWDSGWQSGNSVTWDGRSNAGALLGSGPWITTMKVKNSAGQVVDCAMSWSISGPHREDADGDGYINEMCGDLAGNDCCDADPLVHPGASCWAAKNDPKCGQSPWNLDRWEYDCQPGITKCRPNLGNCVKDGKKCSKGGWTSQAGWAVSSVPNCGVIKQWYVGGSGTDICECNVFTCWCKDVPKAQSCK